MITWLENPQQPLPATLAALPADSDAPGLLAAGGVLTPQRLAEAYAKGIFPWYSENQPVLWWAPDPRMVLEPANFRLSRSLRKTVARFAQTEGCEIRMDSVFDRVIDACATTPRAGQHGTWIVPDMVSAYKRWHRLGGVHSVETWVDGELVGGLYTVAIGRMLYGESMFAHRTDASKLAIAALVCFCLEHGIALIDCQQETGHLASLGARPRPREAFERALRVAAEKAPVAHWSYDRSLWRHLLERCAASGDEDLRT